MYADETININSLQTVKLHCADEYI